jgi:hypothetical protein
MIPPNAPDHELPADLRQKIDEAHAKLAQKLMDRLNTPVPGNPHGGFPGLHHITDTRHAIKAMRQESIEKWNADNPDHEHVASEPLEKPITHEEIQERLREINARPKMRKIDKAHVDHIEDILKDHPEEHHEDLREFIRNESNSDGLRPQQFYFKRATAMEEIQKKGLDPHNLAHRYQHHKETMAEADQPDANNSESPNA